MRPLHGELQQLLEFFHVQQLRDRVQLYWRRLLDVRRGHLLQRGHPDLRPLHGELRQLLKFDNLQ